MSTPPPDPRRVQSIIGSRHPVKGAWRGTSYGYHPHGVVRNGIIFTDHHNVSGSHDAKVILEPESELIYPPTDADSSRSGCQSKAVIRPASGGTVVVYQNGRWMGPDGPWQQVILDTLDELEREIAQIQVVNQQAFEKQRLQHEQAEAALYAKAAEAMKKSLTPTPTP